MHTCYTPRMLTVHLQYYTHERGTYLALYALFLAGSNFLAPVFAGFINDGQGWRWVLVRGPRQYVPFMMLI